MGTTVKVITYYFVRVFFPTKGLWVLLLVQGLLVGSLIAEKTMVLLGNGWDSYPYTNELWQMVIENSLDSTHQMEYTHYDRGAFDAAQVVREMARFGKKGYDRVITVSLRESDVRKDKKTSVPFVAEKGDLVAQYTLYLTVYVTLDESYSSQEIMFAYPVQSYGSLGSKKITSPLRLQLHKKAIPSFARDMSHALKTRRDTL